MDGGWDDYRNILVGARGIGIRSAGGPSGAAATGPTNPLTPSHRPAAGAEQRARARPVLFARRAVHEPGPRIGPRPPHPALLSHPFLNLRPHIHIPIPVPSSRVPLHQSAV